MMTSRGLSSYRSNYLIRWSRGKKTLPLPRMQCLTHTVIWNTSISNPSASWNLIHQITIPDFLKGVGKCVKSSEVYTYCIDILSILFSIIFGKLLCIQSWVTSSNVIFLKNLNVNANLHILLCIIQWIYTVFIYFSIVYNSQIYTFIPDRSPKLSLEYPVACSISSLGSVIGISNMPCPEVKF